MSDRRSGIGDYLAYLKSLRDEGTPYFVEGGQAVNFWAERIDATSSPQGLADLRPFTSEDCDIWVSHETWKRIKRDSGKRLVKGDSPADGQLGFLTLSTDPPRVVDVMSNVYGIPQSQYPRLLERALDDGTVVVIDPIHLFQSKCHCLLHLDQTDRQDERHVRILSFILPVYIRMLIETAEAGNLEDRAVIKDIKLLRQIAGTNACRRAAEQLGIDPESLLPWSRLDASSSHLFSKFAAGH